MNAVSQPVECEALISVLESTKSLCPECLKVVDADIVVDGGAVYMEKDCPEHGHFSHYLWPDADHYQWHKSFRFNSVLPTHPQPIEDGCPSDCGLCVNHQKRPRLVELELTQSCNLRCPLCFMSAEGNRETKDADLSLKEIEQQLKAISDQVGPQTSLQLTGGEPTIRKDLIDIVRLCRQAGFSAIEINTNGIEIGRNPAYVKTLANAGITGIYMQFDGLTDDVYRTIRGADLLGTKLQAIENCRVAGVQVVLSMAIVRGVNDDQIGDLMRFALKNPDVVVGVAYQPAFTSGRFDFASDQPLTMGDVIFQLAEQSRGVIRPHDLWPTGCSHPLCDATTYVVRKPGQNFKAIGQLIDVRDYLKAHKFDSPQGSVLPDLAEQLCPELNQPGLSILVMNYMSAYDIDLERLQQCSMTVADSEGRLIPFCAYQLTDSKGRRLHNDTH